MTTLTTAAAVPTELVEPSGRRPLWRTLVGSAEGRIGLGLAVLMLLVIALGPLLAPYSPTAVGVGPPTEGPSAEHLLGTDSLGRDVFSRFLSGGGSVVVVPFFAVSLAYALGASLGLLAGYARGTSAIVTARILDLGLAIPSLLIMLAVIARFGHSAAVLIIAYGVIHCAAPGRLVRGATQAVVANDYVAAAQARGERAVTILAREVLPNIAGPAIADYAVRMTWGILFINTLSYLGLGSQPPSSNWGLMISQGQAYLNLVPLATLAPAAGIAAIAIAFNLTALALSRHITRETSVREEL